MGVYQANKFVLKHQQIEVDLTLGATPGIPALVYQDGSSAPKSFTTAEITKDQTGLGTLVSVPLVASVDTCATGSSDAAGRLTRKGPSEAGFTVRRAPRPLAPARPGRR